jgi:peptidoglycan L-alanyl-D-glutamate endopeptidase CwlK
MPKFGKNSRNNLAQCHAVLQVICWMAIEVVDFSVVKGHRGKEEQDKAHDEGKSKLKWPESKHNHFPSLAFDAIPYPAGYKATKAEFFHMAGIIIGIAASLNGWQIRWGGNWDMDSDLNDQTFNDWCHFELIKER